jgi:hypothetical protein
MDVYGAQSAYLIDNGKRRFWPQLTRVLRGRRIDVDSLSPDGNWAIGAGFGPFLGPHETIPGPRLYIAVNLRNLRVLSWPRFNGDPVWSQDSRCFYVFDGNSSATLEQITRFTFDGKTKELFLKGNGWDDIIGVTRDDLFVAESGNLDWDKIPSLKVFYSRLSGGGETVTVVSFPTKLLVTCVANSPTGGQLVVLADTSTSKRRQRSLCLLYNLSSDPAKTKRTIIYSGEPYYDDISWSPDGHRLLLSCSDTGKYQMIGAPHT